MAYDLLYMSEIMSESSDTSVFWNSCARELQIIVYERHSENEHRFVVPIAFPSLAAPGPELGRI